MGSVKTRSPQVTKLYFGFHYSFFFSFLSFFFRFAKMTCVYLKVKKGHPPSLGGSCHLKYILVGILCCPLLNMETAEVTVRPGWPLACGEARRG